MAFDPAAFRQELRELLIRHNVSIGVNLEGDTHGLLESFVVIEGNGREHDLYHSRYLDQSDLK